MKVVFSPRAVERLRQIQAYIALDNPTAAMSVANRIRRAAEALADHPFLGRPWAAGDTRALLVSGLSYRLHYRVNEPAGTVEVIAVVHTRQKPPLLP
jgi:toxin ParE1/3/4